MFMWSPYPTPTRPSALPLCHLVGVRLQNVHPAVVESFKIYSFCFFLFHTLFVSFPAPPYQKHQMTEKWKTSSKGNGSHPILKTRFSFRFYVYIFVHSLKPFFFVFFPFPSTQFVSLPFNFFLYRLF